MVGGLVSLCAAIAPAVAAPVTFQFAGVITSVQPVVGAATGIGIGQLFAGAYTFESSTVDIESNTRQRVYAGALTSIGLTIGGQTVVPHQYPISIGEWGNIVVSNDIDLGLFPNLYDRYKMEQSISSGNVINGWRSTFMAFDLLYLSSSTFDGDSLPVMPPSLGSSGDNRFFYSFSNGIGTYYGEGRITSLTAVPVPAAVLLFGSGFTALIGLGAGSWRRRQLLVA
ncbi:MAG: hypothetical protein IT389_04640 [Nitrospira sp.]|nr:hypothetical protein [Nitrospira sp.]